MQVTIFQMVTYNFGLKMCVRSHYENFSPPARFFLNFQIIS